MKARYLYALTLIGLVGCSVTPGPNNGNARAPYDPDIAAKEVKWNEGRVQRDPKGAIGWSQLSSAYLALARQTDDNEFALKAEDAAHKSLSIRRINNSNAAVRLAKSILEQHRFHDSLLAVNDALKINPDDSGARELHAEILAELGRYDDAWSDFKKFNLSATGLSGLALRARLLEIDGKPDDAEVFLRQATQRADQDWDMPREANAWFHLKLGSLLWEVGRVKEASQEFQTAIDTNPHDFKSMSALAKIDAANGDIDSAKEWAEKSIAILPSVEAASLLEDIAIKNNDQEAQAKYEASVDQVSHPDMYAFLKDPNKAPTSTAKPHTHDRLYAVYCADHLKNLPDALVAAKKDLAVRQDIYAFDTLGWVLHQLGKDAEAKPWMAKALSRGTVDAKLFYHAGMIDANLGNKDLAKTELHRAISINPHFQFGQDEIAKRMLDTLGASN